VTDVEMHVVRVYRTDGTLVRTIGSPGAGAGELCRPIGAVSSGKLVFVTDSGNHRIQVFTVNGVYVRQIGRFGRGDGEFDSPHGIALTDRLYVSDRGNRRIQVLTLDGGLVATLGGLDAGGPFVPAGLCVRNDGTVLIADTEGHRIVQWTNR
jgi:tripartite motif-containing protein 71